MWIDVGAHLGETTLHEAQGDSKLLVYAFEPNLEAAAKRIGFLQNFVVIPMAVWEADGYIGFHVNAYDMASSVLPMSPVGLKKWRGGDELQRIDRKVCVPAIRLDTFMKLMKITDLDFLKIDAQGADLAVVKSLGYKR